MTNGRNTIVLGADGAPGGAAAGEPVGVTPSEAIRRALVRVATEEGTRTRELKARQREGLLEQLLEVSKGTDVDAELRRINAERDAW